jgi:squalene-hopene/tetraprenyl-beta-curcumene cyclase
MHFTPFGRTLLLVALAMPFTSAPALAGDEPASWKKAEAGQYLDERAKTWFSFSSAGRGEAATKTACVSCHTIVPYALARPALRRLTGADQPTDFEVKLLVQTKMRVEHWEELDSPTYRLLYDFNEQKKKESWGTEAVLNAFLLAGDDRYQGRRGPSDSTRRALANLWRAQASEGAQQGSWDWLDFKVEPWESAGARYFGAAQAAVAVGTAPGYYTPGADADVDKKVKLLRGYLKGHAAEQNLFNRAWLLWASNGLDGLLTPEERKAVIRELLETQQTDGGWRLASLGAFVRGDGAPQDTTSDGYATGLVLHVLQIAGVPRDDPKVAKGLNWLRANQSSTGEWRGSSVNKKRDPATHVGRFMSDAATAYAVLALSH